jgi:eukaryotic-like serine/threonine-protein kinase
MLSIPHLIVRVQARVGSTLRGKYRLDAVLGVGGMGAVYAATHRNTKRFAVKMLHPEVSLNDDIRSRFLREGYAANSVRHPGTVAVLDDDVTDDGSAFLVMELLEGVGVDSLSTQHDGKLPVSVAVAIVDQLLDVLSAAHAGGIVHRDIKPANLFLTTEGSVKVLDFGIARAREAVAAGANSGAGTATGTMLGSPAFMAPEQAMAKSSEIDAQTDLWAAAATLFTLLSGELVHLGENATQQLILAATQRARSLSSVAPHLPVPLIEVVDRGLTFEKTGRWPNAVAMRNALRDEHSAAFGGLPERASLATFAQPLAVGGGLPSARSKEATPPPAATPTPQQVTATFGTNSATARPVADETTGRAARRAFLPSRRTPVVAVALVLAVVAVGFLALRLSATSPQATTASSPKGPVAAPTIPAAPEIVAPTMATTSATPPPSWGAPATANAESPAKATATTPTAGSLPTAAPHAATRRPSAPAPAVNCNPPYYFDAEHNHVFKKECL